MRRARIFGTTALLVAVAVAGASHAAAGVAMDASMQAVTLAINDDPADVAARCPPGFPQAIVQTTGGGTLRSEAYTGPVSYAEEHCTLLVMIRKDMEFAVAYIRAGEMELTTPGGDTVTLVFKAPGVMYGGYVFGDEVAHRLNGPYAITGGTGIFEGASGAGHVHGLAAAELDLTLNGSLVVPA